MAVAILSLLDPRRPGGDWVRVSAQVRAFQKAGERVLLVVGSPEPDFPHPIDALPDMTVVVKVPKIPILGVFLFWISVIGMIARAHASMSFDVLFTRNPSWFLLPPALALRRKLGLRLIYDCAGLDHLFRVRGEAFFRLVEIFLIRRVDRILAISADLEEYLSSRAVAKSRLETVPVFLNTERTSRQSYDFSPSIMIGYAGSFDSWSGAEILVRAFGILVRAGRDVRLMLVGVSSEKIMRIVAEEAVSGRVRNVGPFAPGEIPSVLSGCDILVVPSRDVPINRITVPIKLYQFMAIARPVVASRVGVVEKDPALRRVLVSVEPDDAQALASAISKLLDSADARTRLGQLGRDFVEEFHSVQAGARYLAESLRRVRSLEHQGPKATRRTNNP